MFGREFEIEGLGAERVAEKLVRGGVPVLGARIVQKNVVRIRVDGKHGKKVFAILQGSCYNIKKSRPVGWERVVHAFMKHAGLAVGAVLFVCAVVFFQGRILKIDVVGSGAYYRAEVLSVLSESGASFLAPVPAEKAGITARILALPRVSFCSLSHEGGVLTVRVEVEDEALPLVVGALTAPADGVVESLTVIRGVARVCVGDAVGKGDIVAEQSGELAVIARVAVRYSVDREYEGSEASARAQAYLDHGEIADIQTQKTEKGWRVTGSALAVASRNLG